MDGMLEKMSSSQFAEWMVFLKSEITERQTMPVKRRRTAKELYEEIKANLIIGYKAKKVKR